MYTNDILIFYALKYIIMHLNKSMVINDDSNKRFFLYLEIVFKIHSLILSKDIAYYYMFTTKRKFYLI